MKSTGIVRNIDELGRVVVPKEIRKKLGISNTDPVEIYVEGENGVIPLCAYERRDTQFSEDYKSYYIDRENSLIGLGVYGFDKNGDYGCYYVILHFNGFEVIEKTFVEIGADPAEMRGAYIDEYFYILGAQYFEVTKIFNAVK
jgi:transcriptional pleiotropic regulator of transition state genes